MNADRAVLFLVLAACAGGCRPGGQGAEEGAVETPQQPIVESAAAQPEQSEGSDVRMRFQLEVPFRILEQGQLKVGPDATWEGERPIEGWERLYLVLPAKVIELDDVAQLQGRVEIRTPGEALAFCRLKTSPTTYHVWGEQRSEVEIVSTQQIDAEFCFGDELKRDILRAHIGSGALGIIASKEKLTRQLGIEPAQVQTVPEGYEVRRPLLVEDLETGQVHMERVREVVGADGAYARKETLRSDLPGQGLLWQIPKFE